MKELKELLDAVAWPLALIIMAIAICVIVFRVTSSKNTRRIGIKLPKGLGLEVTEIESSDDGLKSTEINHEESLLIEKASDGNALIAGKAATLETVDNSLQAKDPSVEFITTKEGWKLKDFFEEFKETSSYKDDSEFWENYYISRRADVGIGGSNQEYAKLAEDNPSWIRPLLSLAVRARDAADRENTFANLDAALTRAHSNEQQSEVLKEYAQAEFEFNGSGAVINFLKSQIIIGRPDDVIADLAIRSASLIRENDAFSSQLLGEFAIQKNPVAGSRFDLAYSYSRQDGNEALSFYHYDKISTEDGSIAAASNNIGVLFDGEDASVSHYYYNMSVEAGSPLANANLAKQLINSGFLDEAQKLLEAIPDNSDQHKENVSEAQTQLESQKRSRDKIIKEKRQSSQSSYKRIMGNYNKFINFWAISPLSMHWPNLIIGEGDIFTAKTKSDEADIHLTDQNKTFNGKLRFDGVVYHGIVTEVGQSILSASTRTVVLGRVSEGEFGLSIQTSQKWAEPKFLIGKSAAT